ncbi:MAG: PAS domain S-box protein [Candidatus Xenobiia bacterium LiM19]
MKKQSGVKSVKKESISAQETGESGESRDTIIDLINTRDYLEKIINTMSEPVFIKDEAHRWILLNDAYCRLTGYTRKQLIGKSDFDFYRKEEAREFWDKDSQVLLTGEENSNDEPFTDARGALHTLRTKKARFIDSAGRRFIVGIISDITSQQRFEEALSESEDNYRKLFESIVDIICVVEQESGKILEINQAAEKLYGYTREELLTMSALDISSEPDKTLEFLKLGKAYVPLRYHRKKDGTSVPVEIKTSPFTMKGKKVVLAVIRDITARLKVEEALRSSESKYRFIAENISDIIVRYAVDYSVLYISPSLFGILGYTPEETINTDAMDYVHPDEKPDLVKKVENLRKTNETGMFCYRLRKKDGSYIWVEATVRFIRDEKTGEAVELIAVLRDIDRRMKAEEEMKNAMIREKQLVELKSRFISMTSHEFGTPLCAILSTLELLENYGHKLTEEKKAHYLKQVSTSARYMVDLLQDVIMLGRFDMGKVKSHPEPVDVEKLSRMIVEEARITLSDNHSLSCTVHGKSGKSGKAIMDEALYRYILSNLLSNAIKYSPQGGEIEFSLSFNDSSVMLEVKDRGIGIPEDDHDLLYDIFHRASNVRNISGTGLGMSIVKRSLDMMGGTISFKSKVGEGTTFTVTLPLILKKTRSSPAV